MHANRGSGQWQDTWETACTPIQKLLTQQSSWVSCSITMTVLLTLVPWGCYDLTIISMRDFAIKLHRERTSEIKTNTQTKRLAGKHLQKRLGKSLCARKCLSASVALVERQQSNTVGRFSVLCSRHGHLDQPLTHRAPHLIHTPAPCSPHLAHRRGAHSR